MIDLVVIVRIHAHGPVTVDHSLSHAPPPKRGLFYALEVKKVPCGPIRR